MLRNRRDKLVWRPKSCSEALPWLRPHLLLRINRLQLTSNIDQAERLTNKLLNLRDKLIIFLPGRHLLRLLQEIRLDRLYNLHIDLQILDQADEVAHLKRNLLLIRLYVIDNIRVQLVLLDLARARQVQQGHEAV